ncbi:MAG: Fur family transcriptional regulator [Actinobacteria bacterium]|nr:Fur family transcriptional regulator [Actinomycetota bacterium]
MRSPEDLTVAFRVAGLKVTPQRQLLFRLLHNNSSHPTADSLFNVASELMPGISLRTVYQTLTDLAEMGELQSIEVGSGSMRFDPNISDHHHAVCDNCGAVHDVYVNRAPELRGLDDFSVSDARIVYRGLCGACSVASDS